MDPIPSVLLTRFQTGREGTFGAMLLPRAKHLVSGEPPRKGNRKNVSCIPTGTYLCQLVESPRFGLVPRIMDVPGRTNIEMHPGNLVGDTEAGLVSDSAGCILPGLRLGKLSKHGSPVQTAVLSSHAAMAVLLDAVFDGGAKVGDVFELKIVEDFATQRSSYGIEECTLQ